MRKHGFHFLDMDNRISFLYSEFIYGEKNRKTDETKTHQPNAMRKEFQVLK